MGIIKRFRKVNHNTSLSLGKLRIGGATLGLILLLGIGEKFVMQRFNLSPEVASVMSSAVGAVISVLFVTVGVFKLARLTPRNRWAIVSFFGFSALIGQVFVILVHLGEEKSGLSDYFPYDVILSVVAFVGGYIAWRVYTTRLRRIKLEREERINRRKRRVDVL